MRKLLPIFVILFLISSCKKDENNQEETVSELVGVWELVSVYYDPGDGSGDFEPASTGKMIEFRTDGTIVTNGSLCSASIETGTESYGTYSVIESTITPDDCSEVPYSVSFEYSDSVMTISYPCIEACQERYVKL